MIQFFALINVVGVVFRNSAPEGRNLHLKVEDSPALRLKASNGKNRNKCAQRRKEAVGSFRKEIAFTSNVNHKGEPEFANKGHEVAFICELNQS